MKIRVVMDWIMFAVISLVLFVFLLIQIVKIRNEMKDLDSQFPEPHTSAIQNHEIDEAQFYDSPNYDKCQ